MKRTALILLLLASIVTVAKQPNIIYFNADDLGVMDVGFMGRTE